MASWPMLCVEAMEWAWEGAPELAFYVWFRVFHRPC
jgi:hypothetical protein